MAQTALDSQLDDYLDTHDGALTLRGSEEAIFVCDTYDKALWAADKLRVIALKQAEIRAAAARRREALLADLNAWEEEALRPLEGDVEYFSTHIRHFHERQLALDQKQKTLSLPGGIGGQFRKKPDTFERDEAALLATVKALGDAGTRFVKVKESLAWADLKKAILPQPDGTCVLALTGEALPAEQVTCVPGGVEWKLVLPEYLTT